MCVSSIYTVCIRVFPCRFWVIFIDKHCRKFRKIFLSSSEKYFLSELRKILGYSFDVKNCDLSIYDVFKAFGVRQILRPALARQYFPIWQIWHYFSLIFGGLKKHIATYIHDIVHRVQEHKKIIPWCNEIQY